MRTFCPDFPRSCIEFSFYFPPKLLISPSPPLNKGIYMNFFGHLKAFFSSESYIYWYIFGLIHNLYLGPSYIVYIWKQIFHFVVSYSLCLLKMSTTNLQMFSNYFLRPKHWARCRVYVGELKRYKIWTNSHYLKVTRHHWKASHHCNIYGLFQVLQKIIYFLFLSDPRAHKSSSYSVMHTSLFTCPAFLSVI